MHVQSSSYHEHAACSPHLPTAPKLAVSEEIVSDNNPYSPPERTDMRMEDDKSFGYNNFALNIAADCNGLRFECGILNLKCSVEGLRGNILV